MFGSIRGAEAEKKALEGKKILRCFFRRRTSLGEVKLSSPEARAGAHDLTRALLLMLLALVMASYLRFPDRAAKPMHVDETTQAVKLGELMAGHYKYDPVDHHGPTLLYATLPVKWFSSARTWNDPDLEPAKIGSGPIRHGFAPAALAGGGWLFLFGDGVGSAGSGGFPGHGFLQPLLHHGNVDGVFHFWADWLRLAILPDPADLLDGGSWGLRGLDARHQGNLCAPVCRDHGGIAGGLGGGFFLRRFGFGGG